MTPEELVAKIALLLQDVDPLPAPNDYQVKRTLSADGLTVEVFRDGQAWINGAANGQPVVLSSAWRRRLHALLSDEGLDRLTD